jgi:hypothetical protein
MKIVKNGGVFLLSFLIGSFSMLLVQSFSVLKRETKKESAETQKCHFGPNIEKPKLRVFSIEDFESETAVSKPNKRLLETDEVTNGEDIKAKSGESWFGLFNKNGKDFLRLVKIKVNVTKDEYFKWKKVSIRDKTNPLFLTKKSKNLKAGEIQTLLREKIAPQETDESKESTAIKDGFFKKFNLGEKEYTLRVEKGLSEKQEPILVLLLETENISQMIHYVYFSDEGSYLGDLYWVGDLDWDGKLDLFMDFYNYEKGFYSSGLFLSSEAGKGKLVKKIEYFALYTC